MSEFITIKQNAHAYKGADGQFHSYDVVSDGTTAERVAAINTAGATQLTALDTRKQEILDDLPDTATELTNMVESLSNNFVATTDAEIKDETRILLKTATKELDVVERKEFAEVQSDLADFKAAFPTVEKRSEKTGEVISEFTSGKFVFSTNGYIGKRWNELLNDAGNSCYLENAVDVRGCSRIVITVRGYNVSSQRTMGFCDSENVITDAIAERDLPYVDNGDGTFTASIPVTNDFFFFSFSKVGTYEFREISISIMYTEMKEEPAPDKFVLPKLFSWQDNPITDSLRVTEDGIVTDFDVANMVETPKDGIYYIAPNGSSGNAGTRQSPLDSLANAIAKSDCERVVCMDGVYPISRVAGAINKGVQIVADAGATPIFAMFNLKAWSKVDGHENVYSCVSNNAQKVVDIKDGQRHYVPVESIEEVDATAYSYYINGSNVYAHYDKVPVANELVALVSGNNLYATFSAGTLYLEGITFIGGNYGAVRVTNPDTSDAKPLVCAKNCHFSDGYLNNALTMQGCVSIMQGCSAHHACDDGFNYHSIENSVHDTTPYAIEIDCKGYSNGKDGATDNGTTIHDGGKVIRINGEYWDNLGPNLADVHDGTESLNIGCVAHDCRNAVASANNCDFCFADNLEKAWLINCYGYGSTYDLSVYGERPVELYLKNTSVVTRNLENCKVRVI